MRQRNRIALFATGLVLGLVLAGAAVFGWLSEMREESLPPQPDVYVPASYRDVRMTPGHSAHLGAEDVECGDCHQGMGQSDGGVGEVTLEACTDCHDDLEGQIHAHAASLLVDAGPQPPSESPTCFGCHRFTEEEDFFANDCMRCHVQAHVDTLAIVQHSETDCLTCHQAHDEPSLVVANCLDCHERHETAHGRVESPDGCQVCHDAHPGGVLASDRCASCHSGEGVDAPMVSARTATFPGHDSCATCHVEPTGGRVAKTCGSCHGRKPTFAMAKVQEHSQCGSCHRPHAPGASARGSCRSCHSDLRSDHPRAQGTCTSCHPAHPENETFVTQGGSVQCTSCHRVAPHDSQSHAGNLRCTQCHAPHDFQIASRPTLCTTCHETQQQLVAALPGHQDCTDCHVDGAHRPQRPTRACAQCHTAERATAPPGHRQCQSCHQPHEGSLRPRASCTGCHSDMARTIHPQAGVQCTDCHRAHGPGGVASPPGCTSCHQTGELPGLHREPRHQECSDCHQAHERQVRGSRQTCTTGCHTGMEDHQPEAQVCTGCHIFERQ